MLRWGLVPSWAKDPAIGNRMINARMETVAEKPAYRRAFASRRCLLPADGYFEWYATAELTAAGKPRKQPFFIRPKDGGTLAMAGLYEIWRDPEKADDDPDRFRWTCTVLTTRSEDAVGHIHDRMPMMVEPQRYADWLDPTASGDALLDLLVPAAPGRLEAYPVSTRVGNVRNNGPELVEPLPLDDVLELDVPDRRPRAGCPVSIELRVQTPHGEGRFVTHRARRPIATLLLGHGAGNGIESRDLEALARNLPRNDISVVRFEQPWRLAGRRVATAPATLDEALVAGYDRLRVRTPLVLGGRSAGARSAARCAKRLGAVGCLALAFPLHPPGKPEKSRLPELRRAGVPTLVIQGGNDAMGRPEEFPPDIDLSVVPEADHGFAVPARASLSQDDALEIVVESTLEWIVREIVGR